MLTLLLLAAIPLFAQRQNKKLSFAFTNSHTAKPFGKFGGLFSDVLHPGFRASYSFNWRTADKHDWFQQFHAGYFYHRYLQHAIPLYTDFGYRYKFSNALSSSASIGAGYMHSIQATAVLAQNNDGVYENGKGMGKPQFIVNLTMEARYQFNSSSSNSSSIFFNYQQLVQAPFIKSYVPVLPYNVVAFGFSIPLKKSTL